jgi:F-type H+-transporting ATPase subunit c
MSAPTLSQWQRRYETAPRGSSFDRRTYDQSLDLEDFVVSKRTVILTVVFLALGVFVPTHAQGARPAADPELVKWSVITAGFALAFAAAFGALAQARGVSAAAEGIARNPSASGEIRGTLILGLVLIESLVIYVLLISLILFFIKPFGG